MAAKKEQPTDPRAKGRVTYLESLTPEQQAAVPGHIAAWKAKMFVTEPGDQAEFADGLKVIWEHYSRPTPQVNIWVGSLLAGKWVAAMIQYGISERVRGIAREVYHGQIMEELRRKSAEEEFDITGHFETIVDAVERIVWENPPKLQHRTMKFFLDEAASGFMGGQIWLSWSCYESFFHEICNLYTPTMHVAEAFRKVQTNCSWWVSYEWGVVVVDRYKEVYLREQGDTMVVARPWQEGPALVARDGWNFYLIDEHKFSPRHLRGEFTIQEIKDEPNAERRRILTDLYGRGRYLVETGAKLLDADYEGAKQGGAPRCLVEDNEGQRWLIGTDGSTQRTYWMPVSAYVKTCVEAHNDIIGFDERKVINKS